MSEFSGTTRRWNLSRRDITVLVVAGLVIFAVLMVGLGLNSCTPNDGIIIDISGDPYNDLQPIEVVVEGSDGKCYTWNTSPYDAEGWGLGKTVPIPGRAFNNGKDPGYYLEKNGLR